MKVLHLTYHYGCASDLNYVFKTLGHDITFFEATCWPYKITEDVARGIWNEKRDWFQSFDMIVTSDTVALSMIFLLHMEELKPRLVIWICNRFNIFMEDCPNFVELLRENKNKATIIPYIEYERTWCSRYGLDIEHEVINPLGMHTEKYLCSESVMHRIFRTLNRSNQTRPDSETFFIPDYHNNQRLLPILQRHGISYVHGRYMDIHELLPYKAVISLPDAFGKIFYHEAIQKEIPVLIPSPQFFDVLVKEGDYGVTSKQHETRHDLHVYCEYYKDVFANCYLYYHSYDDLIEKLTNIDGHLPLVKNTLRERRGIIHDKILKQWKDVIEGACGHASVPSGLKVAIYNGLNVHNEMIGHVIDYCNLRKHNFTVFSNTINYLQWIEFYKNYFGDFINHPHTEFNIDHYDVMFLLTDDDFTFPDIKNHKVICIDHSHIIRRKSNIKRVDIRHFDRTVNDKWVLPVYDIIPLQEKARIVQQSPIVKVACIGSGGGLFDMEKLKSMITNFQDIELHVFVRYKEWITEDDFANMNVRFHVFENTDSMIEVIKSCQYSIFIPKLTEYYKEKMSGSLPLSLSLGCRVVTTPALKDLYKLSSCLVLDENSPIELAPIDMPTLETVYHELVELTTRRNRWYDQFITDIRSGL